MKHARVALPVLALALLTGCGTPAGGTAFEVAGNSVPMSQVDDSAEGCTRLIEGPQPAAIRGEIARMLLAGKLADEVATATRTVITPAMEGAALTKLQGESLMADEQCATAVRGFARYAALSEKLGPEKLLAQVGTFDVKVNPQFGAWDPSRGTFNGASGSLSREDIGLGQPMGQ